MAVAVGIGMTTLALIGSGRIGSTVARLAVAAGYDVVLSNSRGPETLVDLVTELGPHARAATAADAAAAGDLAVVTVPMKAYAAVPVEPLAGKVVIDTNNYSPARDGSIPELDDKSTTSSQLLQSHLPTSKVVKGFNNIVSTHLLNLARPAGSADRSALPIAGDDVTAKTEVTSFLDTIGYDAVDVGGLSESWRSQPGTPVYGKVYVADGEDPNSFGSARPGPADAQQVRDALAAAQR